MSKIVELEQAKKARVGLTPIQWTAWDTPERIAGHPDISNETGDAQPRLLFVTFDNGALKVSATRRPVTMLTEAARIARAMRTWIDGALVSGPDAKLGRIALTLVKRLQLDGRRYIGGGVFEGLDIMDALATLSQIREIAAPPEPPRRLEPVIPQFLRKENPMSETVTTPIPQPAADGLIPVFAGQIGGVACNVCDARTLHAFLEVGKDFTNWIKDRIAKYQFVENQDFAVCSPNLASKQRGGHNRTDYHLTLDMAKELSMVENNEKGRQARRYFIECERRALEALTGNHSEAGVPQMIEHAAEATAMRIAMDGRDRVLTLFGPLANEGDKEQVSGLMIRAKERVKQYLLQLAKRHLKDHGPEQVAAWIMAWTPGKPALV